MNRMQQDMKVHAKKLKQKEHATIDIIYAN